MPLAPKPMPAAPKLVGVAPRDGSPKTTAKPSAGRALGLLSVTVKLSWMSPVEMRVGHTISPCWLFVAAANWTLHPEPATALPRADQVGSHRFGTPAKGPTKSPAGLLVTEAVAPLLTTTWKTEPESAVAAGSKVYVEPVAPGMGVNVELPGPALYHWYVKGRLETALTW